MAARSEDVVDTLAVQVVARAAGLKADVKEQVEKQQKLKGQPTYKVRVEAVGTGLKTSVAAAIKKQMALPKQPTYKVRVEAVGTGLKGSVARAVTAQEKLPKQPVYKVKVVADERGLKGSVSNVFKDLRQEDRLRSQIVAGQERNEKAAQQRVERSEKQSLVRRNAARKALTTSDPLIDYGGKGIRPMNLLYGVVVAMSPALVAMGSSALQASTSIAALGSAGIGAALGLSGVAIAFQGIGDALSLRKSVLSEETTKAANGLQEAARSTEDLAQAKRTLADAQREEVDAARDLHKARQESVRDLEDLRQAVIDLDNQYKSDTLSVAEAKQNAAATDRNFFATALDRARAHQDLRDAQTRLKDTALQRRQKKQDLAQSLRGGIEQSDKVRAARERIRDARDRVLDAQKGLTRQSATTASGVDRVSSASAQLKQKLAELSPAAREMFYWFEKNEGLFKRLQREISQKTLPGFNKFLQAITAAPKGGKSTLQLAADYAGDLGAIISKYAGKLGEWTKSPLFRERMARIQERNAAAFDKLGQALLTLADPLLRIIEKASPGFDALADSILVASTYFAEWIKGLDESGGLAKWFKDSRAEAKKWFDIVGNIGQVLKDVFNASLPAGSSLVEDVQALTQSLADWTSSPEGAKSLKDFFTTIRDLPYAQIIDFAKNMVIMFAAFRAFKFAQVHPFFAALVLFAQSNPALAAQAMATIADAVTRVMQFIVSHPAEAGLLVGILAAAKAGKAIGLDIRLPVLNRLRDALTSRFKVLDKFVGGGATTGTMNVRAAVVNVYGGAGIEASVGTGKGKGKGKGAGVGTGTPVMGGGIGSTLYIAALYELVFGEYGKAARKATETAFVHAAGTVIGTISSKTLAERIKDPLGTLISDAVTIGAGLFGPKLTKEQSTFGLLRKDAAASGGRLTEIRDAANRTPVQNYIAARKESVKAAVEQAKASGGVALAKKVELAETQRSADTLSTMLQQYGLTKEKADAYSRAVYDLNGLMYRFRAENEQAAAALIGTGDSAKAAGDKAGQAAGQFKALNTEIINLAGQKKIILVVDGKPTVISDLEDVAAYQQAIRQGKPPTESFLREQKRLFAKNTNDPNLVDPRKQNKARGGKVGGYSPTPYADNIPAWLTANEYVQPVSAVKYYGEDFMDAIRQRRFPRYATGGLVDNWPFPVKIPSEAATVVQPTYGYPGGGQEYTGRIPRGIGAVKGLNARLMNVAINTHKDFPWATVISGYRPGAITVGGNRSYHGMRRATDWPASMQLFNYFVDKFGKTAREIIYSPAGGRQIWKGQPHMYSGAVRDTHWNHVHLALAQGGLVPTYDRGGLLPPGFSTVFNGTGRNETVRTARQEADLRRQQNTRLDPRDISLLAGAVARTGNPAVMMDGRRVAEVTNRYNYLPAGV